MMKQQRLYFQRGQFLFDGIQFYKDMSWQHTYPYIEIDNEEGSYDSFVRLLLKSPFGFKVRALSCKNSPKQVSDGSRLKTVILDLKPVEGNYEAQFDGQTLHIVIWKGEAKVVTPMKKAEYLRKITIYGKRLDLVQAFITQVYMLGDSGEMNKLAIYENAGGNWLPGKEKTARSLSSVVLQQKLSQEITNDIKQFIESEEWYIDMGIPYKRSYLFYGPPGTGKSSLAQALAGHFKLSISYLNLSDNIDDFCLNLLLNLAPKKSIVLMEDIDCLFNERKNADKLNAITFSGFLNAIDGVRSQEGRIIIMTTNHKEKLDPALLRAGRTDRTFQINLASRHQIQGLFNRFYKNRTEESKQFAAKVPSGMFSMSMIQGFFVKYRNYEGKVIERIDELLNSDENVKIDQYLHEINFPECSPYLKMEECGSLAQLKSLPKKEIERIVDKFPPHLGARLVETLRIDRQLYLKTPAQIQKIIEDIVTDNSLKQAIKQKSINRDFKTIYQIKDAYEELQKRKN